MLQDLKRRRRWVDHITETSSVGRLACDRWRKCFNSDCDPMKHMKMVDSRFRFEERSRWADHIRETSVGKHGKTLCHAYTPQYIHYIHIHYIYIVSIAYNALYAYTLTTYHMYMYILIFTFTLKFIYTDCFSTKRHVGAGQTGVIKFLTT